MIASIEERCPVSWKCFCCHHLTFMFSTTFSLSCLDVVAFVQGMMQQLGLPETAGFLKNIIIWLPDAI